MKNKADIKVEKTYKILKFDSNVKNSRIIK